MSEHPFADWPVISVYTRADALADGDLVAAEPALLHEVGVTIPVAYTRSAYADAIEWTDTDALYHGALQDRTGREHDVLMRLRAAMGRARSSSQVSFTVSRVPRDGTSPEATDTTLYAVCGPGDSGEPVITVAASLDEL